VNCCREAQKKNERARERERERERMKVNERKSDDVT
jgi:hypothetical protein